MSAATSLAYAGGEGVQQHDAHTYWVPRNSQSFLIPAPAGPDCLAAPRAAVAPMGSTSGVAGGRAIGRPVTETPEGPFIPFLRRDGNVSRPNGGQRASQLQAVLSGKRKEKADAPTERPNRLRRARKDRSSLQSHGTTRGKKTEERNCPQGHGHGFPVWERASLSSALKGSRWVPDSPPLGLSAGFPSFFHFQMPRPRACVVNQDEGNDSPGSLWSERGDQLPLSSSSTLTTENPKC